MHDEEDVNDSHRIVQKQKTKKPFGCVFSRFVSFIAAVGSFNKTSTNSKASTHSNAFTCVWSSLWNRSSLLTHRSSAPSLSLHLKIEKKTKFFLPEKRSRQIDLEYKRWQTHTNTHATEEEKKNNHKYLWAIRCVVVWWVFKVTISHRHTRTHSHNSLILTKYSQLNVIWFERYAALKFVN